MMKAWTVLALALCLPTASPYAMYKDEIPNGDHVPHPCKPNFIWHGVGHTNWQGGGARNPFGKDFASYGHKWTETLCRKDSDGDGRTNGQELGDPDCVWSKGQTPSSTTGITHPGVCDPWNEGQCVARNAWLDCSRNDDFDCDAIHDPEVRNITLRFPRTKVPAKETTYICFNFELPDDREYHLIATKPFIDNHNVMHHIVLTRCDSSVTTKAEPEECMMGTAGCGDILELWGLGGTGSCLTPEAGYLIGKGYTRVVSMQFHWTNPGLEDEWYDSSGMVLYYTPKLRQYSAGIMSIGQLALTIPPGRDAWVQSGGCSGRCTEKIFQEDIHIFQLAHHMHYLGIRQNVTVTRKGGQTEILADENPFNYDSPKTYSFDPAIVMHPGDALSTDCTYKSVSRATTTRYGPGSYDEMCFAFLFYYPYTGGEEDLSCSTYKDVDMCILSDLCDEQLYNTSNPATASIISKVLESCDASGVLCLEECPGVVQQVLADNPCLREAWAYVEQIILTAVPDPWLMRFVTAMRSCSGPGENPANIELPRPPTTARPTTFERPSTVKPTEPSKPAMPDGPGGWLLNLVKHLDARPLLQNIIMNVNYNNYGTAYNSNDGDHDHDREWH